MKTAGNIYLRITLDCILSIVLFTLVSFLAGISISLKIVLGGLVYFFATLYFLRSDFLQKRSFALFTILLPIVASLLYFNMMHFTATWISMPSQILLLLAC